MEALRETVATKSDLTYAVEILRLDLTIRMGTIAMALAAFLAAIKYWG